ncbi:2OG-Fe(II) oxygenase [Tsuneonella sp. YG55]|uniref:2OG-Fe(II) oxygenase n=1 Tax=Tsuneonella litorea TaxID=2976475 RepID=A0A9X2W1G4_9SPHN|nr:2OG-Fe(II) oxygenase [Tsuneonella litorea]MCT2558883.1 2OG-Fe(II) oxygenase [Tsuneonella litorea]
MSGLAVVDDVFAPALCRWLLGEARRFYTEEGGFPDSNALWHPDLQRGEEPVRVHRLNERAAGIVCAFLREGGMLEPGEANVLFHAWPVGSFIPWHRDGKHGGAATVYLNERWEPEWGGLFLHRASKGARPSVVVPRFNRGLRNDSGIDHCTTPVLPGAPEPRFSLQVFRRRDAGAGGA